MGVYKLVNTDFRGVLTGRLSRSENVLNISITGQLRKLHLLTIEWSTRSDTTLRMDGHLNFVRPKMKGFKEEAMKLTQKST